MKSNILLLALFLIVGCGESDRTRETPSPLGNQDAAQEDSPEKVAEVKKNEKSIQLLRKVETKLGTVLDSFGRVTKMIEARVETWHDAISLTVLQKWQSEVEKLKTKTSSTVALYELSPSDDLQTAKRKNTELSDSIIELGQGFRAFGTELLQIQMGRLKQGETEQAQAVASIITGFADAMGLILEALE